MRVRAGANAKRTRSRRNAGFGGQTAAGPRVGAQPPMRTAVAALAAHYGEGGSIAEIERLFALQAALGSAR